MIVSHRHRFIFIKTHKTAGSSLEMALGALCDAGDIVTHMETNIDSGIPRNYHSKPWLGNWYDRSRWVRKLIPRHSTFLGHYFYEHMPAWRVRELVGEDIWGSYFKFCFERNPWDKVVSYYLWKTLGQEKDLPNFRDYVMRKSHRLPLDANLYCDQDQLLVDKVYEFRELSGAISDLRDKLAVELYEPLPAEKVGIKPDRKAYADYYNDETKQQVANLYAREIKLMGYQFS